MGKTTALFKVKNAGNEISRATDELKYVGINQCLIKYLLTVHIYRFKRSVITISNTFFVRVVILIARRPSIDNETITNFFKYRVVQLWVIKDQNLSPLIANLVGLLKS